MQILLSDHNCEGHTRAIFDTLVNDDVWLDLVPMELQWFRDVKLNIKASDEEVWQFCQDNGFLLITGNRSTKDGQDSLELKIRHVATSDSLPVITIGNLGRVQTSVTYREQCGERLAEIVHDLDRFRGTMRLYVP